MRDLCDIAMEILTNVLFQFCISVHLRKKKQNI